MSRPLTFAVVLTVFGLFLVFLAFAMAGGGDRPRPHSGLLDTERRECVTGDIDRAPSFGSEPSRQIPAPACPDLRPVGLANDYRLAWMGVALSLVGGGLVLLFAQSPAVSRSGAYWSVAGVGSAHLFVAGLIALSSVEIDILGGSVPDPGDAFDRAATILAIAGVVVLAVGVLLRLLVAAGRSRPAGLDSQHGPGPCAHRRVRAPGRPAAPSRRLG